MSQIRDLKINEATAYNILKDLNMIVSFPFSDLDLINWSQTIFRLYPHATPELIGHITDKFLKGEIEFNKEIGIINYTKRINNYTGIFK